jgi:hypothetical protein
LSDASQEFFARFDIAVLKCFGVDEAAGLLTANWYGTCRLATEGKCLPSTELIGDSAKGLLFRGRNRFIGYFWRPVQNGVAIDSKGFYRLNIAGSINSDGFLSPTLDESFFGLLKDVYDCCQAIGRVVVLNPGSADEIVKPALVIGIRMRRGAISPIARGAIKELG